MEELVKFDSATPTQRSDCIENPEDEKDTAHQSWKGGRTLNQVSTHGHPQGSPENENSQCHDKTGDEKISVMV